MEEVKVDKEALKFIAEKSKLFVDSQFESYRNKQSNAGTIIGVIALFIPFFLSGLQEGYWQIKIVALFPLILLLIALTLLLKKVLFATPLGYAMKHEKFDDLLEYTFSDVLLYEIGTNRAACQMNDEKIDKIERGYNNAVMLVIMAVIFSSLLLFIDKFVHPSKSEIQKIEIIKNRDYEK